MTKNTVTKELINKTIVGEYYFTAADGVFGHAVTRGQGGTVTHPDLQVLTICILRMENGFTVLGQSACADPANFDEQIGKNIAYEDAFKKIWPLMGYELKSRLAQQRLTKAQPQVNDAEGAEEATNG